MSDALRRPVPEDELQRFAADLTTLARALHDLNPDHPEVQSRMNDAEQKMGALTPEQLTMLANAYDRPALSQSVERLRSLMPSLSVTLGQGGATPRPVSVPPRPASPRPDYDPSTTTTLTPPSYGMCTPTTGTSFLGSTIPSDTPTDYGLFIALQIANGAQIPLNFLCTEVTVILGEGTNLPECIIAAIDQAISFGLQVTLSTFEFCDANVLGAENDSAWLNTIAIYNNLATDTSLIQDHLTSVDADLNAHLTAVDSDIDNHVMAINTNVDTNLTAIATDVDTHVAAANLDIDTKVLNVDTDLNYHLNGVDTDLKTHLSAVDADVLASSGATATLQALDIRMEIEKSLALGIYVGLFQTPKAQGGYLELVGTTVQTVINGLIAAGQTVGNAQHYEDQGNTDYAAGQFKTAYSDYVSAYQAATKSP